MAALLDCRSFRWNQGIINRNGEFAVNIALVELGMPVLGVIYAPVTGELFFADVAKGLACKASVWSLKTLECALNEALVLKPFQLTKENVVVDYK